MRTRATAQKAPPAAAAASPKSMRKKKAPPATSRVEPNPTRTVKTRSKKHEKRNSSLPPTAPVPATSPKNASQVAAPAPVEFAIRKEDEKFNTQSTKQRRKNRMVMSRVPRGPDTYVIPCNEHNCDECRTFFTKTIADVNKKASALNKPQTQIEPNDILLACSTKPDLKVVDLMWDNVPALFRTISAYTKMKNHLKLDHNYGDNEDKYPPLFSSATLEQQKRRAEKAKQLKNKHNPSSVNLP